MIDQRDLIINSYEYVMMKKKRSGTKDPPMLAPIQTALHLFVELRSSHSTSISKDTQLVVNNGGR